MIDTLKLVLAACCRCFETLTLLASCQHVCLAMLPSEAMGYDRS